MPIIGNRLESFPASPSPNASNFIFAIAIGRKTQDSPYLIPSNSAYALRVRVALSLRKPKRIYRVAGWELMKWVLQPARHLRAQVHRRRSSLPLLCPTATHPGLQGQSRQVRASIILVVKAVFAPPVLVHRRQFHLSSLFVCVPQKAQPQLPARKVLCAHA